MNPSAAIFCLCMIAVYSSGEKLNKTKRDVSGLYPFPRVGKGDVSWNIGPREMKRQGLIPFPRVGRNRGEEDSGKKRDMTENGGGMWFGPRLGRLQKRNHFNEDENWALVQIRGNRLLGGDTKVSSLDFPHLEEMKDNFSPKLSIESSEEIDQSRDYRL